MEKGRRGWGWGFGLILCLSVAASSSRGALAAAGIGTGPEGWRVEYDGYGAVTFDSDEGLLMAPRVSRAPAETHAALVFARKTETSPVRDFRARVEASTEAQLRTGSAPNSWEVFWLFFNHSGSGDSATTNYFALKPNGVEIGRAYDRIGQMFLWTAPVPALSGFGQTQVILLEKRGQTLKYSVNGGAIQTYTGKAMPQALYDVPGSIALYTEDARVRVTRVEIESLDY